MLPIISKRTKIHSMPKTNVHMTVEISRPVEQVFAAVNNFNNWSAWSPWLIMEPGVTLKVSEDAKYYEWEGNRTGSGNMTITSENENRSISIDLLFLKPWKSKSTVRFEFEPKGESTIVHWHMQGSLPFFLFWMKKAMEVYLGMDFDRGLRLMKDFVEDGTVHSQLTFTGKQTFNGTKFIGIKTTCTKATMGNKMAEDVPKLMAFAKENEIQITGAPFTQYHVWNLVKDKIVYTAGIPVSHVPSDLPDGFYGGELPSIQAYILNHKGPYHHLGNAWGTLYSMQRNKEFAVNKKIHPFELYLNVPGEVQDNELVTSIYFPLK